MIGLLGGTFDPIHFGHLRPALDLLQALELREVRFIPCGLPPHRQPPLATSAQRLAMLERALQGEDGLVIDQRELQREGPSYMVDTLEGLRRELGEVPLGLILGMDAFHGLASWHRWEALPGLCHFIVTHRPGWEVPTEGEVGRLAAECRVGHMAPLRERPAGGVLFCEVTQLDISASHIRDLVGAGKSPRYLLPDSVLEYVRGVGLYQSGPSRPR